MHSGPGALTARGIVFVVAVLCAALPARAQEKRDGRLAERARLNKEAKAHDRAGRRAETLAVLDQVVAIELEVFGEFHEQRISTLRWQARIHERLEQFDRAEELLQRVLAIRTKLHGESYWRTGDARRAIADLKHRAGLTPAQRADILKARSLNKQAGRLYGRGRVREAIPVAEQVVALRKATLGDAHIGYASSLNNLAVFCKRLKQHARAEALYRKSMAIRKKVLGEKHPYYAQSLDSLASLLVSKGEYKQAEPLYLLALEIKRDAWGKAHSRCAHTLNNLSVLYEITGEYDKSETCCREALEVYRVTAGEAHPNYARCLNGLANLFDTTGRYAEAEPLYRQALTIRRKAHGEVHPDVATSLNNLANLLHIIGEHAEAEPLFIRALAVYGKAYGKTHPRYAASLNNLAMMYKSAGEYARAAGLLRKSLSIEKKTLGKEHSRYATSLSNLALVYKAMGEYAKAEPLQQQAREIYRNTLGETHPYYAGNLSNLAMTYEALGDHARAESLHCEATEIRRKALGASHIDYGESITNLAAFYESRGEYAKAEELARESLDIRKNTFGEAHARYALGLSNLAHIYKSSKQYGKAEPLYRQAGEIYRKEFDAAHPYYARILGTLGTLRNAQGDHDGAERLYREALAITKASVGETHPTYASILKSLALLYKAKGDAPRALPLIREALLIRRKILDTSFAVLSERQQFRMSDLFRETLDVYLEIDALVGGKAREAYSHTLAWKGAVLARQSEARLRKDGAAELFRDFEFTSRRLATLSLKTPKQSEAKSRLKRIKKLTLQQEKLEREMSIKSAGFKRAQAAQRLTPAALQEALPEGVVLVDFIEYRQWLEEPSEWSRRLTAFTVPAKGRIRRVDLGAVKPIAKLIAEWRKGLTTGAHVEPGTKLRALLWDPIEEHVAGATIVLSSPDGALTSLPLGALPGRRPGTFLIEDVAVAVVPVSRLLPGVLGRKGEADEGRSLLLLGDVDYGAAPGEIVTLSRSAARRPDGTLPAFAPLANTRGEIEAIHKSFEQRYAKGIVTTLSGTGATEAAFRAQAGRHRWLHLATHGFFASPNAKSAVGMSEGGNTAGYHPGVLSGLVLTGANFKPDADRDDGILTALEVAALDLSAVEVAVLSACETGLGEVAGGEGVLGLQRAFQVAGARATVTSLWQVPDEATRLLMERFYQNLWSRKMGKLEALREAQMWMLVESRPGGKLARGMKATGSKPAATGVTPYHWAAFVLSGDWR